MSNPRYLCVAHEFNPVNFVNTYQKGGTKKDDNFLNKCSNA